MDGLGLGSVDFVPSGKVVAGASLSQVKRGFGARNRNHGGGRDAPADQRGPEDLMNHRSRFKY